MFARHFFGSSDEDIKEMLSYLGYNSLMELYRDVSGTDRILESSLELPPPLSEDEAYMYMRKLADSNRKLVIFAGGGAYDVYTPRVVKHILSRSEFYTSYTPYQPEVSQGTLQVMFEFQSLMVELTGMEVANASVYDGATALAEAVLMSFRIRRRYKAIVPMNLNPTYKQVLRTYTYSIDAELVELPYDSTGRVDLEVLESLLDEDVASVILQHPNYFGILEEPFEVERIIRNRSDALFIVVFDPVSLAILEPPGSYGADIAVAEGQSLGVPLSFGGPYVGIFTSLKKYVRQMPGRIVGLTYDKHGRRAFVSTLQAREQHIRRAKATSNICTNQQLVATHVAIYLTLMGYDGLREVALRSLHAKEYLMERLEEVGLKVHFKAPTFREFVVELPYSSDEFISKLASEGFLVGPKVSENLVLIATTEKRSKEEIDALVEAIKRIL